MAKEYEEYERRLLADEFAGIIKMHNEVLERLERFRKAYPYLLAPNIFDSLEGNLKENVQIMYRELQNLHRTDGPHYEKKYICKRCHQAFMIALPEGLCDKCRAEIKHQ
ncbi:hypothetical protein J7M23_12970 [Candidatus Sumerlaeota bacterium]|nr:hypothetical protein [Candidatus Sumerlaeota bacterium]